MMNKEQMVNEIIQKLKLVNVGVIKPESIDDNKIDELREIHEMVTKRDSFSPSEMSALTDALGQLRK
ncbi:DUF1128 domain-containing protein [Macrococcus epidermidis]|uniref:DUF1128 domain-containing protein n=2 Tax=Staphylococcaceae TaxID=90964 RepID=A0A327ZS39_9STAP|nr:DUF1128 domain-containing protein [Macrococcus sp. PK]RAK45160.1 DUF1128 domain-containing protein [Macrococcus epidermidis]UTH15747.1 DUF1128 domain-containing protein [Macrococcus epidermidis]